MLRKLSVKGQLVVQQCAFFLLLLHFVADVVKNKLVFDICTKTCNNFFSIRIKYRTTAFTTMNNNGTWTMNICESSCKKQELFCCFILFLCSFSFQHSHFYFVLFRHTFVYKSATISNLVGCDRGMDLSHS